MKQPLFAFFGTPAFAVDVLNAMENHGLLPAVVVCAPDKKRGRGLHTSPAPAKVWAMERNIDVLTPSTLKDADMIAELSNTDWDVFVTAAYAKLVPKAILDIPRRGALNVHPSLLPKYRGPSPVLSAILANDRTTGVSIMLMDEQLDHGPIVAQGRIEIDETDWPLRGSVLEQLLATEGGNLLAEVLPEWIAGSITPVAQDDTQATVTKKFTDDDARVDVHSDYVRQLLKIRAFDKGLRAHAKARYANGKEIRVVITDARLENDQLHIVSLIPEGKREMSYDDFIRGGATLI